MSKDKKKDKSKNISKTINKDTSRNINKDTSKDTNKDTNKNYTEQLIKLVEKATSPFHTVEAVKEQLLECGYEELFLKDNWKLKKGGTYFICHHGSTIFAFSVGENFEAKDGFRIAASHGDFPAFRIKPNPEIVTEGYMQLNVESYGGVNLASWLDRGLSAAGRVLLKSDDIFHPTVRLIDLKKTLFTIPNVAIHLNREMNKGVELNKQTEMLPLAAMVEKTDRNKTNKGTMDKNTIEKDAVDKNKANKDTINNDIVETEMADNLEKQGFMEYLAEQLGVQKEDILDYELNVYNTDKAERIGLKEEFISAPRLDNLTSVQALTNGMMEGTRSHGLNMIVVFDHEEIGSRTKQGAGSVLLSHVLEKIYLSLGMSSMDYKNAISESLLMSVDVSHGFHPSYSAKYDPTNRNVLNQGFCLKEACSQSYATDSEAVAIVQQICEKKGIAYQKFVNRSDVIGGGTLGSIASAMLPVRTVDLGVPLLAMHSSREIMGAKDQESLTEFMKQYFQI